MPAPFIVTIPMIYDDLVRVLLGLLVLFVTVRTVVRWWDLVAI